MKATAELQVVPVGAGVSVRGQVSRVVELLRGYELRVEPHASGTNLEGELEVILAAVAGVLETLHAEGTIRAISLLKLDTRVDKLPSLEDKQL
jgi:uncharacterized protein (TIGR00106 family)